MIIGFSNGNFFLLNKNNDERLDPSFIENFKVSGANAIEIICFGEDTLDTLINMKAQVFSHFEYISIHAPGLPYKDDELSNCLLSKLKTATRKFNIKNIVFHIDIVSDWAFLAEQGLPISIENMDDDKSFGRTVADVQSILNKYPFGLTLDLQHCYVNDNSMKLAQDFQEKFKDRIVQYHLSGYQPKYLHHTLFTTNQDNIIDSLMYKNIPTIIESTFEKLGDQVRELEYIKNRIDNIGGK